MTQNNREAKQGKQSKSMWFFWGGLWGFIIGHAAGNPAAGFLVGWFIGLFIDDELKKKRNAE